MKRFIDDVAVEVVETCLLGKLRLIMDPVSVAMMSDTEVSNIAAENEESRRTRYRLQTKLQILQSGTETFKTIVSRHGIGGLHISSNVALTNITDPEDSEAIMDESKESTDAEQNTPETDQEDLPIPTETQNSTKNSYRYAPSPVPDAQPGDVEPALESEPEPVAEKAFDSDDSLARAIFSKKDKKKKLKKGQNLWVEA